MFHTLGPFGPCFARMMVSVFPWKGGALRQFLRDSGHLIRPAAVLIVGLAVFLLIRTALIPKAFGKYGHYDAASLDVIRQHPISYAGQDTCVMCHDEEAKARASGKHAHVSCEACPGRLVARRPRAAGGARQRRRPFGA